MRSRHLVPLVVVVLVPARRRLGVGRVALGRRDLQAAPAHRGFAVQRVRRDPEHLLGDGRPLGVAGSSTASPRAARSRVGTDGDPLGAGTKLPAGQTFVFGKNARRLHGHRRCHLQLPGHRGRRLPHQGRGRRHAGRGRRAGHCAAPRGPGLTFPTTGADFTFTRRAAGAGPAGHRRQQRRLRRAVGRRRRHRVRRRRAPRPRPRSPSTPSRAAANTTPRNGQNVPDHRRRRRASDNQQGVSNFVEPRSAAGRHLRRDADRRPGRRPPATSEGIFVGGLGPADRAASHVGQTVTVSGKVTELFNLTAIDATGRTPVFGAPRRPAGAGDHRSGPGGGPVDAGQRHAALLRDARGDARAPRGRHRRLRRHRQVRRALPAARHHAPARVPHRVAAGRPRRPAEPRPGRGLPRRRSRPTRRTRRPRPRA